MPARIQRAVSTKAFFIATLLGVLLCGAPASARHTEDEHITDDMAYALRQNEVRLGIWKAEYGLPWVEGLQVGSYTLPWIISAAVRQPILNGRVKYEFWHNDRWATEAAIGVTYLHVSGSIPIQATVVPFEINAAYRLNDSITFGLGILVNRIGVEADATDVSVDAGGLGALAVTNGQLLGTVEWRWSTLTAMVFQARAIGRQNFNGTAEANVRIDDYTRARIVYTGQGNIERGAGGSLAAAFVWSWDTFNLRAGLQTGDWVVPIVGFVAPNVEAMPELDLYWRF